MYIYIENDLRFDGAKKNRTVDRLDRRGYVRTFVSPVYKRFSLNVMAQTCSGKGIREPHHHLWDSHGSVCHVR